MAYRGKAPQAHGLHPSIYANAVEELEASRMGFHRTMMQQPPISIIPHWSQWLNL